MMTTFQNKFDSIFIDPDVADSPIAQRFKTLFPDKIRVQSPKRWTGAMSAQEFSQSKRNVHLTKHRGAFFKRCPGNQKGLACCNYFVLNLGFQCDMDCSYCYLQSFLNSNFLTIYTNGTDAFEELRRFGAEAKDQPVRVGTGEVIDSLSLDPLTLYSNALIAFFRDYPRWTLEFKTKSDFVDQFIEVPHAGNVTVSWSINPKEIVDKEEHGTASIERRLKAASRCLEKGFRVAFHMDPLIWHPDWKSHYGALIDDVCQRFRPEDIPYISLGALRYQPEQKAFMRERFGGDSYVTQAETFKGKDGKLRYDYGLRQEMFQWIIRRFKDHDPKWNIFLCMETPEVWMDTFGNSPHREESLKPLFQPLAKIQSPPTTRNSGEATT